MYPPSNQAVPSNHQSWSSYENSHAGFGGATYQQGFAANPANQGLHQQPGHHHNHQQYQQQPINSLNASNTHHPSQPISSETTPAPISRPLKRAKRHRKRHVPVGPAGLWFQQQQQKSSKPGTTASIQTDPNNKSETPKDDDDEKDIYNVGVKRETQRGQELAKPSSFYSTAWYAMQIESKWDTPPIPANVQSVEERAKLIRPHAPSSFWLVSEIKDRLDAAKEWSVLDKNLMVLVEDVHEHHWLLWTVTLTDETGAKIHAWIDPNMVQEEQKHYFSVSSSSTNKTSKKGDDGTSTQKYIQVGYVWHLVGCSVMLKQRTEDEVEEDGPSENRSPEEESSPERMLLIGNQNIKSVWTPEDLNHVDDSKYVAWLERRNNMGGEALQQSAEIEPRPQQDSCPSTMPAAHPSQQRSISIQNNGNSSPAASRQGLFEVSRRHERALPDIVNGTQDFTNDPVTTTTTSLSMRNLDPIHKDRFGKNALPANEFRSTNSQKIDGCHTERTSSQLPDRPTSRIANPYQHQASHEALPELNLTNDQEDSPHPSGQDEEGANASMKPRETESANDDDSNDHAQTFSMEETRDPAQAKTAPPPAQSQPPISSRKKRNLQSNPFSQFMATPLTSPPEATDSPVITDDLLKTTPKEQSSKKKIARKKPPLVNQGKPSQLWSSGFESEDFSLSDDDDRSAAKGANKAPPTNRGVVQQEQTATAADSAQSLSSSPTSEEEERATDRPNAIANLFADNEDNDDDLEWSDDD